MRHTLWLSKDISLNASLQCSVEQRVKHGTSGWDLVVGGDIFLECDTAVRKLVRLPHVNKDASS